MHCQPGAFKQTLDFLSQLYLLCCFILIFKIIVLFSPQYHDLIQRKNLKFLHALFMHLSYREIKDQLMSDWLESSGIPPVRSVVLLLMANRHTLENKTLLFL